MKKLCLLSDMQVAEQLFRTKVYFGPSLTTGEIGPCLGKSETYKIKAKKRQAQVL